MTTDWKANHATKNAVLGTNNKGNTSDRESHDYYATPPVAVDMLLEVWQGSGKIWECAAGQGHMSKALQSAKLSDGTSMFRVKSTDLIVREDLLTKVTPWDFLETKTQKPLQLDIVTNPPYSLAEEFIRKALEVIEDGYYVCMFLPIRYLEGKKRRKLFDEYPLYKVVISSGRITCALNGDFEAPAAKAGAASYAWFIWQKGSKCTPILEWAN